MTINCCLFGLSYADIVTTLMLLVTIAIFIVGYRQLKGFIKGQKVDFTYKVYKDLIDLIHNPAYKAVDDWLFKDKKIDNEDDLNCLGDLFEKIEAVYSLLLTDSLDEDTFYWTISFYIDLANSKDKKPSAKEFIEQERNKYAEKIPFSNNLYESFKKLVEKIKDKEVLDEHNRNENVSSINN